MDLSPLGRLINRVAGGSVGIDNLTSGIGEERDMLEDVVVPFLTQPVLLRRTHGGATLLARLTATLVSLLRRSGRRDRYCNERRLMRGRIATRDVESRYHRKYIGPIRGLYTNFHLRGSKNKRSLQI